MNLFARFGSVFMSIEADRIVDLVEEPIRERGYHNQVVMNILSDLVQDDVIILGWGGYPKKPKAKKMPQKKSRVGGIFRPKHYEERIKCVLDLLNNRELWTVGGLVGKGFPQHGSGWYDYEPLQKVEIQQGSSFLLKLQRPLNT